MVLSAVAADHRQRDAWYAIQTKASQETRAEQNLRAWGVETFLPEIRVIKSAGTFRRQVGTTPLFRGYLFVRCVMMTLAPKVRFTRGVSKILGDADGPIPIDERTIDLIRDQMDQKGIVQLRTTFAAGDHVRVLAGPLQEFVGVFEARMTSAQRVRLLLTTVNGRYRAVVDAEVVEKIT